MADNTPAKKGANGSAKNAASGTTTQAFTDEERAIMRERVQEVKASARRRGSSNKADDEAALLAKIAEMPHPDREIAHRVHAIVQASAPNLSPKLWYSMPAYANHDGNVVCFFQSAQKFKTRYATLGFSDKAHLDDGSMWPTAFALKELNAGTEAKIVALVKKAAS